MDNLFYAMAFIIFLTGFWIMLSHANLIKKIIGMNIMESAIFLFLVAIGYVKNGSAPIITEGNLGITYVNPLPSALILTGIVVSVSVTAFALGLVVRLYQHYGTVDVDEITRMRSEES
jgi:multicomponent Na+:H+ antiporter subunit C